MNGDLVHAIAQQRVIGIRQPQALRCRQVLTGPRTARRSGGTYVRGRAVGVLLR
jgi:hypothetical protein